MKWIFKGIVAVATAVACMAQGTVTFNNRTSTGDAKVTMPDGSGPGMWGAMAQLLLVSDNGVRISVGPATPFRSSSAAASYFIMPVDVTVPGIPAGSPATFAMGAWIGGTSYQTATQNRAESSPVTVSALGGIPPGGGAPITTPDLAGLQPFSFLFPEPSTVVIGLLGGAFFLLMARRKQTAN